MYGDIKKISENVLMIEGQEPSSILLQPDIANSLIYKSGSVIYIMDTGGTIFFRNQILKAVTGLRPFTSVVLLNSHAHVDHTANNSIINEINAQTKKHYISKVGIDSLDHLRYFETNFNAIAAYYNIEDGPNFPTSILFKPIKLIRWFNPELVQKYVLPFIIKRILKKFGPLEPSKETAKPFEDLQISKLSLHTLTLEGWNLNDDVFVIPSRGHSPDSVSFYVPKEKVLFLSDEMVDFFNCWTDSTSSRVVAILKTALTLYRNGDVRVLIGGHQQQVFKGEIIEKAILELLENHAIFKKELLTILAKSKNGLTIPQIYKELDNRRNIPAIDKYFRFEFPKMPPLLKTYITCALLEEGIDYKGDFGRKQFALGDCQNTV